MLFLRLILLFPPPPTSVECPVHLSDSVCSHPSVPPHISFQWNVLPVTMPLLAGPSPLIRECSLTSSPSPGRPIPCWTSAPPLRYPPVARWESGSGPSRWSDTRTASSRLASPASSLSHRSPQSESPSTSALGIVPPPPPFCLATFESRLWSV